jgi:hypothetical protein
MKKLLVAFALLFATFSAHASMIWRAVAIDAARFAQVQKNPDLLGQMLFSKGDQTISLDKDWHGIHYLLTGTAWDVTDGGGLAILGGEEFGDDMGYGPAHMLTAAQVKAIAAALAKTSPDSLAARYDAETMMKLDIYPAVWDREGPQALAALLRSYGELVAFYRRAADQAHIVVIVMV